MNPPLKLIEGFFKRVWGKFAFERVVMVGKGLFLIRFTSEEDVQRELESGTIFFDKHPVMVKKWYLEMNMSKEEVQTIIVWVQLLGVHTRYWNSTSLSKIVSQIRIPKQTNHYTAKKTRFSECESTG